MNTVDYQFTRNRLKDIAKEEVIPTPYVKNAPNLKDYGLTKNTEIELKKIDMKFIEKQRKMDIVIFICIFILGFIIGKFIFHRLNYILLCVTTICIQGLLVVFEGNSRRPPKTRLHLSYEQYIKDTANYNYWAKKKNSSYWLSLKGKGTEFEYALAELFCIRGYKAILTK